MMHWAYGLQMAALQGSGSSCRISSAADVEEELSLPGMDAWTGDLAGQWPAPAVRAEAGALRAGGPDLAEVAGSAKPPGVVRRADRGAHRDQL